MTPLRWRRTTPLPDGNPKPVIHFKLNYNFKNNLLQIEGTSLSDFDFKL